ncbi:54S ribosomal protein L17 mitochondrial [Cladochytrium tenue]|nr:54S ribosomal protein L17 mitochondrial [Cladochytrium tenue]
MGLNLRRTLATVAAAGAKPRAAAAANKPRPEIRVGLLIKRNPTVLRPLERFEEAYLRAAQERDRADARPFNVDFYFKRGTEQERRFLQAQKELGASPDRPAASRRYDYDLGAELARIEAQGDRSKKDADLKSLDRQLDRALYLVMENGKIWTLPSTLIQKEELLHESADRFAKDAFGGALDLWRVGKVPVAHHIHNTSKVS